MAKISPTAITLEALKANQFLTEFPKIYELKGVIENNLFHQQQTVYDHTVAVLEGLLKIFQLDFVKDSEKKKYLQAYLAKKPIANTHQTLIFLATVFHDIAKKEVLTEIKPGQFFAPGHELLSAGIAKKYLTKLDLTDEEKNWITDFIVAHGYVHSLIDVKLKRDDRDFFTLFRETVGDLDIGLLLFVYADLLGSDLQKADPKMYQSRIGAVEEMLDWITL